MKKTLFRKLMIVTALTLGLCLLVYPLLLPTENYFRLVLQLLLPAVLVGLIMLVPLWLISDRFSKDTAQELKKLKLDSGSALAQYPELRPLARQVSSLKAQIDAQMNELTGQQEQLRVLTDNMQEGLLLISARGRVLSHNHAALQLLGKERKIREETFSVYDLSDAEPFRRVVGQALGGARASAVLTIEDTAVQLIANPVTRENRLTGAVMVLLDVTEREKRDALRREFTANISHELKTPLTSIYGIADMMESGMVKKKDISGFAKRICDESSRMITLIEDIIRLSRLDDESFTEEVLPLDLYEIAESVLEQLRPAAEAKSVTITLEGESAPMQGVPVIVEEMLYNLCDNAIKYNVEHGDVRMKVACTEQQTIFTVNDTGIGIPQADRERIFERFYRVDKSHSKQIGGTGLGLSIVKHGAQFHNATIELDSRLGVGTTVTLFFPRSAETAAAAESSARFDPLNVDVPGAAAPSLIQLRDSEPDAPESGPAVTEPVEIPVQEDAAADVPEIPAEQPADEPVSEADSASDIAADTAEDTAAEEPAAKTESEQETPAEEPLPAEESFPEYEEQPLFAEEEAEPEPDTESQTGTDTETEPDTEPESETEAEPAVPEKEPDLILDEADRLLQEAAAALELDLFGAAEPAEPEAAAPDSGEPEEAEP